MHTKPNTKQTTKKDMNMNTANSIWIPQTRQEAWDCALILCNQNQSQAIDLIKCHASFGHHFNYDMGIVMVNTTSIKGKPTMRADAVAGITRSSGTVRRLQVMVNTHEQCIIECERTDEPAGVVHTYEFNIQMAHMMGLTNNSNWKRMPIQMLRARCIAMACRAVWPEAVSGIYTSDEIADSMQMTDKERFEATARSLGEDDLRYQPSTPPAPAQPAPAQPAQPAPAQPNKVEYYGEVLYINNYDELMVLAEEYNIEEKQIRSCASRKRLDLRTMSADELTQFWYDYAGHIATRNLPLADEWWTTDKAEKANTVFKEQYKALTMFEPSFYGPRMSVPAFVETLNLVCDLTDDEQMVKGIEVLRQMNPNDWSAYDYVKSFNDN